MARKPKQKRALATYDAIVEAGFLCVASIGKEGTTTHHIADKAGVSIGTLYEYFSDKNDVYDAMNQRFVGEAAEMVQRLIPELTTMPIREVVITLFERFSEFLQRNDGVYLKVANQALQDDVRDHLEPMIKVLTELLMQYIMNNPQYMGLKNITTMSYIVINAGIFIVLRHLSDPAPPITYKQLANGVADMVDHYIRLELA